MAAPQRTTREDMADLRFIIGVLDRRVEQQHTRIQNLEQQNDALETRIHALEVDNQALKTIQRGSKIPESVHLDGNDAGQIVEDTPDEVGGYIERYSEEPWEISHQYDLIYKPPAYKSLLAQYQNPPKTPIAEAPEYVSPSARHQTTPEAPIDDSLEHDPSPAHHRSTPPPTTNDAGTDYTVWYENGTLHTNAPAQLLTTQPWLSLLTAFTTTSTFFATHNTHWSSLTHPTNCVRGVIQRQATTWTNESPGEYCCKRCFNTQRVCLKYNKESERLEALPLPEEVRSEEFGVGWFVAEEVNMSNKAGYKGLW